MLRNLTNRLFFTIAVSLVAVQAWSAESATNLFADPVVARGKGFEIKKSNVQDSVIAYKASRAARGQPVIEAERPLIESNALQRLIITSILVQRATDEDRLRAKADTEKYISKAKEAYRETFEAQIRASGMSLSEFTERAVEQNVCEIVLERELKSKITIKEEAIRKFYDEHPEDVQEPEQVRVSHILFATLDRTTEAPLSPEKRREKEKLAREVRARAEKGENWQDLVQTYSEDIKSKEKKGEYVFSRGRMPKEFEAAAFSMKTNQVSDIVETKFGFHIIKCLEKLPARKMDFAAVAPRIKNYLIDTEFQDRVAGYIETLKRESKVEILR